MASRPVDAAPPGDAPLPLPLLRPMARADIEAVAALEAETFTMPWSRDTFSDLLDRPDAGCVVAVAPGVGLAGYAVYWWVGGEAELGDLAVREPWRGRGIGSALIRDVLDGASARGIERVFLEVREGNRAARSLYRRHGFREAGRRPDYYRDPREDAIVMALTLSPARPR